MSSKTRGVSRKWCQVVSLIWHYSDALIQIYNHWEKKIPKSKVRVNALFGGGGGWTRVSVWYRCINTSFTKTFQNAWIAVKKYHYNAEIHVDRVFFYPHFTRFWDIIFIKLPFSRVFNHKNAKSTLIKLYCVYFFFKIHLQKDRLVKITC